MQKRTATPVTKEELEGILDNYPTKLDLKETLSDYPTKSDLKEALNDYPTKTDLKKELSNYPTKADLNRTLTERLTASQNSFRAEMDHKLFAMEERLNEKITTFANKILTAIDPLIQELETRRHDREIGTAQIKKVEERLDKHDVRITHLEQGATAKTN